MWRLRRVSIQKKVIISIIGGVVIAPIAYILAISIYFFGFYNKNQRHNDISDNKVKQPLAQITVHETDTLILEKKIDSVINKSRQVAKLEMPFILTIDYSGFEDVYVQQWFFDKKFELKQIDYNWGGEGFSGNGYYLFDNSSMTIKIDTARDEGYSKTYTYYYNQSNIAGGIKYNNIIQMDPEGVETVKDKKKEILTRIILKKEEKKILAEISNHIAQMTDLQNSAKFIDNIVELKKVDTINYNNYGFSEITRYSLDTAIYNRLIRKN
jgi:hypothetical protein